MKDRQMEYALNDNAAFRLFCGYGLVKKWHVPDHTKIEEFRSRLLPETQRMLANLMAVHAVKLNYANPVRLDVDSTIQEANITYPSQIGLLVKTALLAKKLIAPLQTISNCVSDTYKINLKSIKALSMQCFWLKRKHFLHLPNMLQKLWRKVFREVLPVLKDGYKITEYIQKPKHWAIKRAWQQLQHRGRALLEQVYEELFITKSKKNFVYSLHAFAVACFNKNKLSQKVQYGRAFQIGRIEGNFAIASECTSLHMHDSQSLEDMLIEHDYLFGEGCVQSLATDKKYHSLYNEELLEQRDIQEFHLPYAPKGRSHTKIQTVAKSAITLHNRRAGIEPVIGHIKQGGQLGKSRMKSDMATLSAGYAAILGFNLRQLKRYILGKVRPKFEKIEKITEILPTGNPFDTDIAFMYRIT